MASSMTEMVTPGVSMSTRRVKRELDQLRREAETLTEHLKRLRGASYRGEEEAMVERRKRRRAEEENAALREALQQQSRVLRQIKGIFIASPVTDADGNWCETLHRYVRLPHDVTLRRTELNALMSEQRLRYAMHVLDVDTRSISFQEPSIQSEFRPISDGLLANTVGVYALETTDISQGLRAACVAIRDIAGVWPQYDQVNLARQVLESNASSACYMQYGVDSVWYKSRTSMDSVLVQTRVVTSYSVLDGCGIVMWDFVDDDDQAKLSDHVDVVRCAIGACLIRLETCDDGVDRVVCRTVCSKKYQRQDRGIKEDPTSSRVDQFLASARFAARPNGIVFKDIVMEQVVEEQMLLSIAVCAC